MPNYIIEVNADELEAEYCNDTTALLNTLHKEYGAILLRYDSTRFGTVPPRYHITFKTAEQATYFAISTELEYVVHSVK